MYIISECSKLTQINRVGMEIKCDLKKIDHTNKWNMQKPGEWDAQTTLGFWETNESFNFGLKTKPGERQQQRKPAE